MLILQKKEKVTNTLKDTKKDDVNHGMISCPNCNETMNIRCERCGFRCKCGWKADDRDELRTHIKYENLKEKNRYPTFIRSLSYTIDEVFTDVVYDPSEKIIIEVESIISEKGKEKILIDTENKIEESTIIEDEAEPTIITEEEKKLLDDLEKELRDKSEAKPESNITEKEKEKKKF